MTTNSPKNISRLFAGFSLIELTVALLIVVLLAGIALRSTNGLSFQVRYEQTQERLNRIKEAIIGNPHRTVNGQPDISGFVADMGRLPLNIHELLEPSYCLTDRTQTTVASCGASWQSLPTRQPLPDSVSGLWYGWNGPYLNISNSVANPGAYSDAWGREAQGFCSDPAFTTQAACVLLATWTSPLGDHNYGWWYNNNGTAITTFSYGKDHVSGGSEYDSDYPAATIQPVIAAGDWRVNIANGIDVQFQAPLFSGICREDNTAQTACYGNAGHWKNCLFLTPTQCATAGGSWATDCRMTQTACTNKGGAWSGAGNPQCTFTETTCPAAGGTWSATDGLCIFSASTCFAAGGAASQACLFNATTCSGTGKTWTATTNSCSFTSAQCAVDGGIYTTSGANASCLRIYKNAATGEEYTETSCLADGFGWYGGGRSISLCMKVFYRQNGAVAAPSVSSPIVIEENNTVRQLHFSGFSVIDIPIGINAIGIYKHDGTSCTTHLYPSDRQQPVQVQFNAHSNLSVINW